MAVYGMTIDTMLVCFVGDEEANKDKFGGAILRDRRAQVLCLGEGKRMQGEGRSVWLRQRRRAPRVKNHQEEHKHADSFVLCMPHHFITRTEGARAFQILIPSTKPHHHTDALRQLFDLTSVVG